MAMRLEVQRSQCLQLFYIREWPGDEMFTVKDTTDDQLIDLDGNPVQEAEWLLHISELEHRTG